MLAGVFFAGSFTFDQGPDGELATATAEVVRYDDGPGGFGERRLVVRFPVGDSVITTKVRAEDRGEESHVPPVGGHQQVEYLISDPRRARPAGAAQAAESDAHGMRILSYGCLFLAVVTAAAYVLARRRRAAAERLMSEVIVAVRSCWQDRCSASDDAGS